MIASFFWSGASGMHVADPDLVGVERAGRQHLHAGDDHAVILLAHHAQRRHRQVLLVIEFRVARGLRRHHGVDDIDVVVADVAVVAQKVLGMRMRGRQLIRLHRHAGDERGDVVGGAAEHAEGEIGDPAMPLHAPLQVVAVARSQVIDRVPRAVLFVAHGRAVRRVCFQVVNGGYGCGGIGECGMPRDVVDPFAADIDHAAVAQRFQMFLAGAQHRPLPMAAGPYHDGSRQKLRVFSPDWHCGRTGLRAGREGAAVRFSRYYSKFQA